MRYNIVTPTFNLYTTTNIDEGADNDTLFDILFHWSQIGFKRENIIFVQSQADPEILLIIHKNINFNTMVTHYIMLPESSQYFNFNFVHNRIRAIHQWKFDNWLVHTRAKILTPA